MNECLTTSQHQKTQIGYWVSEKGKRVKVKSCAINKISQFSSFKIFIKIQNQLNKLKIIQGGIEKIPLNHIYQIYHFLSERDDCTPSECGARSWGRTIRRCCCGVATRRGGGRPLEVSPVESRDCRTVASKPLGARCSSLVRAFAHGAMGRRMDPS